MTFQFQVSTVNLWHHFGSFKGFSISSSSTFRSFFLLFLDTKSFDDAEIESTILKCSQDNAGYLLCPHTAVAVKYFYELKVEPDVAYVCIATASPAKFPEAIAKSGLQPYNPPEIQALFELEEKFETMDQGQDWEQMLREKIVQVST